ncbi:MAG TPA: hypothetical protein VK856_05920, partial [Anaerolineaceae bacterium]|nr:hypothetical protein [Anaerolineaceae bacterium]
MYQLRLCRIHLYIHPAHIQDRRYDLFIFWRREGDGCPKHDPVHTDEEQMIGLGCRWERTLPEAAGPIQNSIM